jgi:hypothetical protein
MIVHLCSTRSEYETATMANGPLWDGKVYKRAKFGDLFEPATVKGFRGVSRWPGSDANGQSGIADGVISKRMNSRRNCDGPPAYCKH